MLKVRRSLVVVLTAAALSLTACGNSSDAGNKSAGSGPTLKGDPIKILTLTDTGRQRGDDQLAGLEVGIKAVNAAGGVKGRPIEEVRCTNDSDVNVATNCVRKALSDGKAVALVGTGTGWGGEIDPILMQAKFPSIGNAPLTGTDLAQCTVCFALTPGGLSVGGEGTAAVGALGAKKLAVPYTGIPAGAQCPPLVSGFVGPMGAKVVGSVALPLTAADFTPQAATIGSAKPDYVVSCSSGSLQTNFIKAFRSQGYKQPILITGPGMGPKQIQDELAGANDNIIVDSDFKLSGPAYDQYQADKKKYAPDYKYDTTEILRAYTAVKLFAEAASKATEITPAGLLSVMNSMSSFDGGGLVQPALDYSKPQAGGGGKFPRAFATTSYLYQYENGKFVEMHGGKGVDVFTGQDVQ